MTVWVPIGEPTTQWNDLGEASIALEDGSGIILREDGGKILLEIQPAVVWMPFPRYVALTTADGKVLVNKDGAILIVREPITIWTPIGD